MICKAPKVNSLDMKKQLLLAFLTIIILTGTDDPSLAGARVIIKVLGHQHWWLAGGYDLEIGHI